MRKKKWANFCGDALAAGTVVCVLLSAKRAAVRYGQKLSVGKKDVRYLLKYALNRFLKDGEELENRIAVLLANALPDKPKQ